MLYSIAILLLFYTIQLCIKRGVAGRLRSIEEGDLHMRRSLVKLAGRLEDYKREKGFYPNALIEMDKWEGYKYLPGAPFQYKLSDDKKTYDLKGAGWDRKFGTIDDVVWGANG